MCESFVLRLFGAQLHEFALNQVRKDLQSCANSEVHVRARQAQYICRQLYLTQDNGNVIIFKSGNHDRGDGQNVVTGHCHLRKRDIKTYIVYAIYVFLFFIVANNDGGNHLALKDVDIVETSVRTFALSQFHIFSLCYESTAFYTSLWIYDFQWVFIGQCMDFIGQSFLQNRK